MLLESLIGLKENYLYNMCSAVNVIQDIPGYWIAAYRTLTPVKISITSNSNISLLTLSAEHDSRFESG
jgi:hypothetical protein